MSRVYITTGMNKSEQMFEKGLIFIRPFFIMKLSVWGSCGNGAGALWKRFGMEDMYVIESTCKESGHYR